MVILSCIPGSQPHQRGQYVETHRKPGRQFHRSGQSLPDSVPTFYACADYTTPPTTNQSLPAILCAFTVPEQHGRIAVYFSVLPSDAMVYRNNRLANGPNNRPRTEWTGTFLAT